MTDDDELLPIADAARLLGLRKYDMRSITEGLLTFRTEQGEERAYKKSRLIEWALQDIASLKSRLRLLLARKYLACPKWRPPSINCRRCGSVLKREKCTHQILRDARLDRLLEHLGCATADLGEQIRKLVEYEHQLAILIDSGKLDGDALDATEKRAAFVEDCMDRLKPLVGQVILRCSGCPEVYSQKHDFGDALNGEDECDDDLLPRFDNEEDELRALKDELATMTTGAYRIDGITGRAEPAGDLDRGDQDD